MHRNASDWHLDFLTIYIDSFIFVDYGMFAAQSDASWAKNCTAWVWIEKKTKIMANDECQEKHQNTCIIFRVISLSSYLFYLICREKVYYVLISFLCTKIMCWIALVFPLYNKTFFKPWFFSLVSRPFCCGVCIHALTHCVKTWI